MLLLGLVASPWAVLAVPAALLIGFAFASVGLAATTWMRSWIDFDLVFLAILPMFLFSTTFFPLSEYPEVLAWVVRVTPLYQGVALERALILGGVDWATAGHVLYLAAMGWLGVRLGARRLQGILQP
jgi:lipooligosaccharide transport system permease protein